MNRVWPGHQTSLRPFAFWILGSNQNQDQSGAASRPYVRVGLRAAIGRRLCGRWMACLVLVLGLGLG